MDRKLIKAQSKQLIKKNVFKLFVVTFVGIMLVNCVMAALSTIPYFNMLESVADSYNEYENGEDFYNFGNPDAFDSDYFSDFGSQIKPIQQPYAENLPEEFYNDFYNEFYDEFEQYGNFDEYSQYGNGYESGYSQGGQYGIEEFSNSVGGSYLKPALNMLGLMLAVLVSSLVSLILLPTQSSLRGYYVSVIRGKKPDISDGIKYVYKNAFSSSYFKRLCLEIIMNIAISFASLLFIIPGIILSLHWFFARQILNDNPDMDVFDALRISGEMTKGHKSEIFVLDLSFIGWFLLSALTFGLGLIYVLPYYNTTVALYYQNFKMRAIQEGKTNMNDFMSNTEKNRRAQNSYYSGAQYAQPFGNRAQQYADNAQTSQPFYQQNTGGNSSFIPTEVPFSEPNSPTFTEAQYSEPTEPEYAEETEPVEPVDPFVAENSETEFAEPVDAEENSKISSEDADLSDTDEYIQKDDDSDTDDTFKM